MSIISTRLGNMLRAKGTDFDPRSDIPASDTQSAIEYLRATIAGLSSVYQPLDSDLTAIAALTTTAYGRALLALADGTALAALVDSFFLTPAEGNAAYQPLDADLTAWAAVNPSAYLNTAAIAAAYQPLDSDLTAIAALTTTSYGRAFLALADAAAARAALALGTIATQAANNVAITGGSVTGITDIAIADGGTGQSTAAAGFDALAPTTTRGDIIFRNATVNARLAAGTSGYALQTNGASADPTWVFKQETLTAARTYYVRTDGNDSNTGLVDSSGGAFLTIQAAVNAVALINLAGQTVTIQVRDGTYTANVDLKNVVGAAGSGSLILTGNSSTPTNVYLDGRCRANGLFCTWQVTNMKIGKSTQEASLYAIGYGSCIEFSGINFAIGTVSQIWVQNGGKISAIGNYTVSAGSASHMRVDGGGMINTAGYTCTISGTPAYSAAFAYANVGPCVIVCHVMTFSGSATGPRYFIDSSAVIYTGGGGATYLPGNSAGSTATDGVYV